MGERGEDGGCRWGYEGEGGSWEGGEDGEDGWCQR